MCKRTHKMPFIGDFSLQNGKSNIERQTNKKLFDVFLIMQLKLLILAAVGTQKRHFYS